MSVLLANRQLTVQPRLVAVDTHGDRAAAGYGPARGPAWGWAKIGPDVPVGQPGGRTWVISLDPTLWPVYQQDRIIDAVSGEVWTVTSADLMINNVGPWVNYIRVEAHYYVAGTRA